MPGAAWEIACALVRRYEFTDPRLVRAVYSSAAGLLGRDMLLEGRFLWLRFYLGVRITGVADETRVAGLVEPTAGSPGAAGRRLAPARSARSAVG